MPIGNLQSLLTTPNDLCRFNIGQFHQMPAIYFQLKLVNNVPNFNAYFEKGKGFEE
jgi:hypothetical protein